jgi:hypothetical protein
MTYYILTDCVNLSHEIPGKSIGERYESQSLMNMKLSRAPHHNDTTCKLPLYVIGMKMKENQLYRTNCSLNSDCCYYYVIQTNKFVQISMGYQNSDVIDVDLGMVDQMFGNIVLE